MQVAERYSGGSGGNGHEERSHGPHLPESFLRADPASRFKMEGGEMGAEEEVGERRQ